VQRVLSARDEGHAKAERFFGRFPEDPAVFMLVLPGIIAFALFPEQVKKPDFAYPTWSLTSCRWASSAWLWRLCWRRLWAQ